MNHPSLSVVIPAAGASERLGQPKQLVEYHGKSLIQNAVEMAQSLLPLEIIVVTGANTQRVEEALQPYPVRLRYNPHWSTGMGGSIALGAGRVSPESTGLMIHLCDQWRINIQDMQKLAQTWQTNQDRIVCATADGINMPPVIFPSKQINELESLASDRGARSVLEAHPELLKPVAITNAAFDLDTRLHLNELEKSPDN